MWKCLRLLLHFLHLSPPLSYTLPPTHFLTQSSPLSLPPSILPPLSPPSPPLPPSLTSLSNKLAIPPSASSLDSSNFSAACDSSSSVMLLPVGVVNVKNHNCCDRVTESHDYCVKMALNHMTLVCESHEKLCENNTKSHDYHVVTQTLLWEMIMYL